MYNIEHFDMGGSVNINDIIKDLKNEINEIGKASKDAVKKVDDLADKVGNLSEKVGELVYKFVVNSLAGFKLIIMVIIFLPMILNVLNLIANLSCVGSNLFRK